MQEQIEAVQRMQEYIEKHLRGNISFADVAKVSLFSPWYARRLFLEYTGVTPSEYIRKLRLKQSAPNYGMKMSTFWMLRWIPVLEALTDTKEPFVKSSAVIQAPMPLIRFPCVCSPPTV